MPKKPNIREIKDKILLCLVDSDFQVKKAVEKYCDENSQTIDRRSVYNWLKKDEQFKAEFELLKEELLDEAEQSHRFLRQGIPIKDEDTGEIIAWQEKPDRAAIEFFLKSKGNERGYSDTQKVDHTTKGDKLNGITLTSKEIADINDMLENDV